MGPRGPEYRGAAAGLLGPGRGRAAGRVDQSRTSTSTSCRTCRTSRRTPSAPGSTSGCAAAGTPTCACSTTRAPAMQPEARRGRIVRITDNPTNAVFNLQGMLAAPPTNELKVGYNSAPTNIVGRRTGGQRHRLRRRSLNLSGSVANTGIAGQGSSSGIAVPGGLVRANSATNGHAQPVRSLHTVVHRLVEPRAGEPLPEGRRRSALDPDGDRPHRRHHLHLRERDGFPRQPGVDRAVPRRCERARACSTTAPLARATSEQEYFIGYAQDEWRLAPKCDVELRPPLRLLHAAARGERPAS